MGGMKSQKEEFDKVLGRLMGMTGRVMIGRYDRILAEAGHDLSAEQVLRQDACNPSDRCP